MPGAAEAMALVLRYQAVLRDEHPGYVRLQSGFAFYGLGFMEFGFMEFGFMEFGFRIKIRSTARLSAEEICFTFIALGFLGSWVKVKCHS